MDPTVRLQLWAMFFASIRSFQHHPGNAIKPMSLAECAVEADKMLALAEEREFLWRG